MPGPDCAPPHTPFPHQQVSCREKLGPDAKLKDLVAHLAKKDCAEITTLLSDVHNLAGGFPMPGLQQ
jgi:hypothetical protein